MVISYSPVCFFRFFWFFKHTLSLHSVPMVKIPYYGSLFFRFLFVTKGAPNSYDPFFMSSGPPTSLPPAIVTCMREGGHIVTYFSIRDIRCHE